MAAAAAGLVLMMTGCSSALDGDALYQDGADRYFPLAKGMHSVLMSLHEGEWTIGDGGHGAMPTSCRADDGGAGYFLDYVRALSTDISDPQQVSDTAARAFEKLGLTPDAYVLGDGDDAEWYVVAEGDPVGRAVVTIRPVRGEIDVTARTACTPGDSNELSGMVLDDAEVPDMDAWRRLPATEVPESVPQFYFPKDGPVYYNADRTPVQPQPLVTDPPKAPYGS
jgi:hypothetical protein